MATDATGTPTSLGIPKFNTAADAPSGLGTNAMMDSIDTLTAARVVKPSGIVSGEVPVWSGSSWDRSSVTRINADGSIKFNGYGTSLPGSPYDGEVYILVDSTTASTYQWTFRYNAGSASAFKWEFVGGAALRSAVEGTETTASAVNTDLATVQSVTLPRSGDYDVTFGAGQTSNTNAAAANFIALTIAGVEITSAAFTSPNVNYAEALSKTFRMTGRAANDVLKEQYRVVAGTGSFGGRFMFVTPVRVS